MSRIIETGPEVSNSDSRMGLSDLVDKYQPVIFSQSFSVPQFWSVKFNIPMLFSQLVLACHFQ